MNSKPWDTFYILWGRINGGLNSKDYSEWASNLLICGIESKDIVYLAANEDLHWQEIETLFRRIMLEIKEETPENLEDFCLLIEKNEIQRYKNKEISGVTLVNLCENIWQKSEHSKTFYFWFELYEDLCIATHADFCKEISGEKTMNFIFDKENIELSIKEILKKEGKI